MQRRRKPRRESTPRVAVTVRVPLDIEQQRRRLEEKLNVSTPMSPDTTTVGLIMSQ